MSVKVIKNKVFDGSRTYEVGDSIEGLSEDEESQLVSNGVVEYGIKKNDAVQQQQINVDQKDTQKPSDEKLKSSEDKKEPADAEKDLSANKSIETVSEGAADKSEENSFADIDPKTFALNADEYANGTEAKTKTTTSVTKAKSNTSTAKSKNTTSIAKNKKVT